MNLKIKIFIIIKVYYIIDYTNICSRDLIVKIIGFDTENKCAIPERSNKIVWHASISIKETKIRVGVLPSKARRLYGWRPQKSLTDLKYSQSITYSYTLTKCG